MICHDIFDAEALLEELRSLQVTVTGIRVGKSYLSTIVREYQKSVLKIVHEQPTADVVPKSEVDRVYYNLRAVLEERAETKREIAREIFEEIEKLSYRFMNDKHYIFGDMVWDIAELKKKYTEGKDE